MIRIVGRIGFVVVVLLALVGIRSAVSRFLSTMDVLFDPTFSDADANAFHQRYYAHPYLSLLHIVPGFLFMVLGPLQFVAPIRNRWPKFHRQCGKVFLLSSLAVAITALVIVPMLPVFGTFTAKVATVFGSGLFLFSIVKAYRHIRRYEIDEHREWMIRSFAIGLGISTFRVYIPILLAPPFNLPIVEAWDTVVWAGFVTNLVVAEWWISVTRHQVSRPAAGTKKAVSAPVEPATAQTP